MNTGTINYNFFQVFILFLSLHGILFSALVFLAKKYRSKSVIFLGLTVFFISISNLHHMLVDIGFFSQDSIVRKLYIPWHWLVASMFFLFTYYFLHQERVSNKVILYLIVPFFVIACCHFLQFLYQLYVDSDHTITYYYERGLFLYTNFASFLYIPFVIYQIYKMILRFEEDVKDVIVLEKIKKETDWLKNLIHFGIGITSIGLLSAIIGILFNMKQSYYGYPFFISISVWLYWVGYVAILRSQSQINVQKLNNKKVPKKKGLGTFDRIDSYIQSKEVYLQSDLNRDTIAAEFGISSGYLSQLINHFTETNFNEYINKLRVESSKQKLLDKQYANYTIELVGLECGFKSKSNFYAAFKKHTGLTPNQFKKENLS